MTKFGVSDVDEHAHLGEALSLAARNGIKVAVSNPCFEVWFVLHYEDQAAHIERNDAQAKSFKLLGCKKVLTKSALEGLAQRYEAAVRRAKALDKKHEGDGSPRRSNPSSEVWKLVDQIVTLEHS